MNLTLKDLLAEIWQAQQAVNITLEGNDSVLFENVTIHMISDMSPPVYYVLVCGNQMGATMSFKRVVTASKNKIGFITLTVE